MLDDGIRTLAYFHKDSITSCNKKEEIKEDCDNWKKLWLKKTHACNKINLVLI